MPEKTALHKLLIKPNQQLVVINSSAEFASGLGELPAGAALTRIHEPSGLPGVREANVILLCLNSGDEMRTWLPALQPLLPPAAILWAAYPKGAGATTGIHRDLLNACAGSLGLKGVTIIAIDPVWSALRLKTA